jgi:6-phosphogluconolactonase
MTPLPGSPYPTGAGTFCIKASPDRRILYVAPGRGLGTRVSRHQKNSPQLVAFRVQNDGSLHPIGEPLALPPKSTPVTMAISADGRNLYLGIGSGPAGFFNGAIAHFRITDDGRPHVAGPPVRLGRRIDGAAQPILSTDGKHLYVASVIAKAIVRLDILEDGSLSQPRERTKSSGVFPITPAFSADGRTLYVANEQSKSISAFRVAPGGSLAELPSSPYPTGRIPHNPALSRDGRFIYFANTFSGNITGYAIGPDGTLTPLAGSPFRTPVGPAMLSVSTSGTWLYLISSPFFGRQKPVVVTSWRIGPDGDLERSGHPPAPTGLQFADGPSSIVLPIE